MNLNHESWVFRNLANIITGIRLKLCIVIAFLGFFYSERIDIIFWWALVAILTDPLDGIIARKFDIVSPFGAKFDRFTDKLFEFIMFAIILDSPYVGFWLKLVIWPMVFVEIFLLATIYLGVYRRGINVSAGWWGKAKMILVSVATMASILMIARIQQGIWVPMIVMQLLGFAFLVSFALGLMSLRGHINQYIDQVS